MEPKGYVCIKREFTATKLWPDKQYTLSGIIDLETEYKKALAGKPAQVMDIACDGSGYLVLGYSETTGSFLWTIEKEDTIGDIIPVQWKNGQLIPTGMSPMDEILYMMKDVMKNKDKI